MAPVPITKVISSTSEDTKYPADNILGSKKWLTSQLSNHRDSCEIILQLRIPSIIHFIDIGYINASSVEISAGCSWWPSSRPYETILSPTILQTQNEARLGKHRVGCKMFNCPEHLNTDVCEGKWDRVKIILKQIYSKNKQMGLEFVRISNSRTLKLGKTSDPVTPSSSDGADESLGGNTWKNSPLARLRLQAESKESPEIDILKDKLLRISGTTEDGSSNENTLTRTAKMVLSSRATSNQATLKKLNLKSTGSFSTNQPKDNKFIDLSAEPTTSQSKSFTTTSTKSSNPRFSTQSKAINSINSTSKSSLNQERPRHSEIKSPNSNGNDRRGLKNSSNAGIKNVTPKGKSPMSSGKPYCDAMKSPEIFSSRLPTPKSKRAATISDSTSEEKSYPSPHCGLVKSNYDVDNVISPRNERNAQVRRASSPQAETPKAKRCLKLKPAQRQNPSTNSIGDSAKLRNDDVPNFSCNQTTELPTTSKSAFSPKLNPKSLKLDPKSPKVSSLHKVPVITNDGISGSALKANVIETHSDVSIETEDLTRSEIRRIKKKIERFFNSLDMHEMNPDNVTLKELRLGFEVTNNLKLDKRGREYFRNATANFLDLVMSVKQCKNNEIATTSKSGRLSSDEEDCEITQTTQGVQCPLCMEYFAQDVISDHAALCGDDAMQSGSRDVEIVSTSRPQQQHRGETFIDLSDNMGLTDAEKQRWLDFSCKPKPYHPRMDKSLFQGHQLVKCPTCGQYYKADDIQEHGDECAEKVNSGFVKRGLYFVKDGS